MNKSIFHLFLFVLFSCNTSQKINDTEALNSTFQDTENQIHRDSISEQNQNRQRIRENRAEEYEIMVSSLLLSEEQRIQFEAINRVYQEKLTKKREEARSSGSDFRSIMPEIRKIREEQNMALKNLLTDSQFEKYEAYLNKIQEQRRKRRQGSGM